MFAHERHPAFSPWYTLRFRDGRSRSVAPEFSPPTPSPRGSANPPEPRQRYRERILLVDDEEVLRRLALAVLTRQGYTVFDANGPLAALAIAAEQPDSIDLILADVMMPGMRGWEMVERLRPLQPRARVLYMSGYVGEIADADKVRPLLSKPFKPRELLEEIRRVLDA
jgi:two-component system cell cycle sensor histidine kinase/response regulator CckA